MKTFMKQLKKYINLTLGIISTLLLTVMSILVIYQVASRYLFHAPSDFTQEWIRYLLIWTGFIGGAYAFVTRQHMALIYFREKISANKLRYLLVFVDTLILLFAFFVMLIGGTQLAISVSGVHSALLGVSRSLVYSMGPISGAFTVVIQIINIWEDVTGNYSSTATDVVPDALSDHADLGEKLEGKV